MEPLWEWKWAAWDEKTGCFVPTPVWMTDAEARADWWAFNDQRSHKIDHAKRDRNRSIGPLIDPPADNVDWSSERQARAKVSRYKLPPFFTPTYEELRRIWSEQRNEDVRRLALEVQCGRYALSELEALTAEEYWHIDKQSATIVDARKAIARIRRRLRQEMERIGPLTGERR
ncbi:hypothetical protein [Paraburkholderia sp. J94]|uniref:hypothetical protein n=1 Tax=Paraburkholderia sp. J94 TaxID=2805441 RepID=UPI002AB1EDDF|nr:hypothetical protein [Paraburkholderia sp. J94]